MATTSEVWGLCDLRLCTAVSLCILRPHACSLCRGGGVPLLWARLAAARCCCRYARRCLGDSAPPPPRTPRGANSKCTCPPVRPKRGCGEADVSCMASGTIVRHPHAHFSTNGTLSMLGCIVHNHSHGSRGRVSWRLAFALCWGGVNNAAPPHDAGPTTSSSGSYTLYCWPLWTPFRTMGHDRNPVASAFIAVFATPLPRHFSRQCGSPPRAAAGVTWARCGLCFCHAPLEW